uniref:SPARK domain-containing protein n=1 Tax=Syphacia muris TaxID=451379 RepID=A0A0N5ALB6_9BILA
MTICKIYNLYPDSFKYSVLSCWIRYGNKISLSCASEEANLESSFLQMAINGKINAQNYTALVCRNVIDHDVCYMQQVGQYCDRIALRFILQLNERTPGNILPNDCKQWLNLGQLQKLLGDRSVAHRRALNDASDCNTSAIKLLLVTFILYCYSCFFY